MATVKQILDLKFEAYRLPVEIIECTNEEYRNGVPLGGKIKFTFCGSALDLIGSNYDSKDRSATLEVAACLWNEILLEIAYASMRKNDSIQ